MISEPTKVYFSDASVAVFPDGITVKNNMLEGGGRRYSFDGRLQKGTDIRVTLDSVSAMTYYELYSTGGSPFASFLLGLYGSIMTPLSVYCIACPKCCFGSCPTVYDLGVNNGIPEAELFSYSISRFFQEHDVDRLNKQVSFSDTLRLRLTNEALETHYIDQFKIFKVKHPLGTTALPTPEGDLRIIESISTPRSVKTPEGLDVTALIAYQDSLAYRTGDKFSERTAAESHLDWLDLEIGFDEKVTEFNLVLRLRNSLLTTVLFYDLVLAGQGVEAVSWTGRMQNDYLYARLFTELYRQYAGIRFYIDVNGSWVEVAKTGDSGPIAWKDLAVPVKLPQPASTISLRMTFFPDNFIIDRINLSPALPVMTIEKEICTPVSISGNQDRPMIEVADLLDETDEKYLITEPGDFFEFCYAPETNKSKEITYFIESQGYYIEWLRGDWIHNRSTRNFSDFLNQELVLNYISTIWEKERSLLESAFFDSRIPLRRSP